LLDINTYKKKNISEGGQVDIKDYLRYMLDTGNSYIMQAIEDISDEESLEQGGLTINHIRWNSGHLLGSAGMMLELLGERNDIPEDWKKVFTFAAELSKDTSVYPSMQEIREKLNETYDRISEALEKVSIEELESEKEISPEWKATPAQALLFFFKHEFYHLGQITTLRKILGRERMFR
jgi:uncharacterized damage-inducible protein DinB